MKGNKDIAGRISRTLTVSESDSDWLLWLTESGHIINASASLCSALHSPLEAIIGKHISHVDPSCGTVAWKSRQSAVQSSHLASFSSQITSSHGNRIPVIAKACAIQIEGMGTTCTLLRYTKQREASPFQTDRTLSLLRLVGGGEAICAAEAKLEALEAVIESATFGIIHFESSGRIKRINASGAALLGFEQREYPHTISELVSMLRVSTPSGVLTAEESNKLLKEFLIQPQRDMWFNVVRPDGESRWLSVTSSPIKSVSGKMLGAMASYSDITNEVNLAEAVKSQDNVLRSQVIELRRNSSMLDRAEQIARLGYWEYDIKTRMFWGSKFACEIYGLAQQFIPFELISGMALPEYRPRLQAAMTALIQNGAEYDIEFQIRRVSDGAVVDVHSQAVFDGVEQKVFGCNRDISDKKIADINLRKLHQAIEQSPASIIITDTSGKIEYVNPKFCQITGYKFDEAVGQNPRLLKSENTPTETYDDLWRTIRKGKAWQGIFCNKKKNGEYYWEQASISPVIDSKGLTTNYVAVKEDITQKINNDKELTSLSDRAMRRLEYLQATHAAEIEIRRAANLGDLQVIIVREISKAFGMAALTLWSKDKSTNQFEVSSYHYCSPMVRNSNSVLSLRRHLVKRAAHANSPMYIGRTDCANLGFSEGFMGCGYLPLSAHGQLLWLLEFRAAEDTVPTDEWWDCLETIAAVSALALHNAELLHELTSANTEVVEAYDATLEGWANALDLRDRDTEGHSRRVTNLAVLLARNVGLADNTVLQVKRGALLHDVGKLGVPDHILKKQGGLNTEEWRVMQMHPVYADEWLSKIRFLQPALAIPRSHHEHWDGTGYPLGLCGKQIPIEARLFTIVDVWDALTNDRPYRSAWPRQTARKYMLEQSGQLFDPEILSTFIQMLDNGQV